MKHRIFYILTHPIQYQAPFLRLMASMEMDVTVLFYLEDTSQGYFDAVFGKTLQWDIPLLEGYRYFFLENLAQSKNTFQKLKALWKAMDPKKYDVVWAHGYTDIYMLASIVFAKLKGLKVVTRGDSMLYTDTRQDIFRKISRTVFFKLLTPFVDRYLAVGTANRQYYLDFGVPEKKVGWCYYAVDNDFFRDKADAARAKIPALKAELHLENNRPIILFVGKFSQQKCPDDLLKAYLKLLERRPENPSYLLFVGAGELNDTLQSLAKQCPAETIRFLGFKNQTEVPTYYALADILVLPTQHEKWGLVLNESMNADCAIIASNHIGSAADLVRHDVNGYIFPVHDIDALSHYLEKLVIDPEKLANMKIKGRERIAQWGLKDSLAGAKTVLDEIGAS